MPVPAREKAEAGRCPYQNMAKPAQRAGLCRRRAVKRHAALRTLELAQTYALNRHRKLKVSECERTQAE